MSRETHRKRTNGFKARRALPALVAAGLIAAPAIAQDTSTWTGGESVNWADTGNWDAPPGEGDNLVFTDAGFNDAEDNLPTNNNIVGGVFHLINFNNNYAGPLTVSGEAFTLVSVTDAEEVTTPPRITQGNSEAVTLQTDIVLGADTFLNPGNNVLILDGHITGDFALHAGGGGSSGPSGGVTRLTNDQNDFTGMNTGGQRFHGTLEFTSIGNTGEVSALGTGTGGALNSGNNATFRYIGTDPAGHTSNRVISFGSGGSFTHTFDASGAGPLTLTANMGRADRHNRLAGTGEGILAGNFAARGSGAGTHTHPVIKHGSGSWELQSGNNEIGHLRIEEGTLLVTNTSGSATWTATEGDPNRGQTVVDGATALLGGTGSIGAPAIVNLGTISPGIGSQTGRLSVGSLDMSGAPEDLEAEPPTPATFGTFQVGLNGLTPDSEHDVLSVTDGDVVLGAPGAGPDLDILLGFAPELGDQFTIIETLNSEASVFGRFAQGNNTTAMFDSETYFFSIHYNAGSDGNDVMLTVIPEPAALSLLGLGGLLLMRRRR